MSEQQEAYVTAEPEPSPVNPDELVRRLAALRQSMMLTNNRMSEMQQALEASEEYRFLHALFDEAATLAKQIEAQLRSEALENFKATGNKKYHPSISVRINTRLVYDEQDALDWSGLYLPKALKLDARLFEKHARAVLDTAPLTFVKVITEPQATISSELGTHLSQEQ